MMNIQVFIAYLSQGREIEFRLNGNNYFLQPDYNNKTDYILYCCETSDNSKEIYRGNHDEILKYDFGIGVCLQDNFDSFEFLFIL